MLDSRITQDFQSLSELRFHRFPIMRPSEQGVNARINGVIPCIILSEISTDPPYEIFKCSSVDFVNVSVFKVASIE